MKILLLLLLLFCQDTNKLIEDLNSDDPIVRDKATAQLIEHEKDLDKYKALLGKSPDPEVKWRLQKAITSIEANQKFRAMTTISPLITLKFEGMIGDLFVKLKTISGQNFDARTFGDNKVIIDCKDTPLFQLLDSACKQIGYDWDIVYKDAKDQTVDIYTQTPIPETTSTIELTSNGMNNKTPCYTGQGFKMQAVQTSFGINNQFNGVNTELVIQFKYATETSLKFAYGPKIKYTKVVNDSGNVLAERSTQSRYALIAATPTTKSISIKGKAIYRIPMKVETLTFENIETLKPPPPNNPDSIMRFAQYPNFVVTMNSSNSLELHVEGEDQSFKERFTGTFSIVKTGGTTVLESRESGNTGSGYLSVYSDHLQLYLYGQPGGDDAISKIIIDYITEFRDVSFDFSIDNIPLY